MIRRGKESAMEALYSAYAGYLTGVCMLYIAQAEEAEDVLHDSFLKIFSFMGNFTYRGPGSLKAWLKRIVVNEALKTLRRNHRAVFVSMDDEPADMYAEEPDTSGIDTATLHDMIRHLPTGYRTVFNLHVVEGKSHKEIAALLGISESTSASQFHRAKAMLARQIKNMEP